MNKKEKTGLYFIDDDHKILYVNKAVKELYPEIEAGQYCYNAFACRENICPGCPLMNDTTQRTVFNSNRKAWFHSHAEEAELPGFGKCRSIMFTVIPEDETDEKSPEQKDTSRLGMLMVRNDMLEQQNQILKRQNKLMESIADGMPGGYHRCATEEGYPIVYASKKFLSMLGFTETELHEKFDDKLINLIHPDDTALFVENVEHPLTCTECGEMSIHYRILTKNGYMQVVDTTKVSDFDGEKFLQCIIVDISDENRLKGHCKARAELQKALEDALIREQSYRHLVNDMQDEILDSISCGVFSYSVPDNHVLTVNNAAKAMIGCGENDDPYEKLRSFMLSCVVESDRSRVISSKEMLKKPGDMITNDYKAKVNEKIISVHSNIKLLERADGSRYIMVTLLDTTELEERNSQLNNVLTMQKQMADSLGSGVFAYTLPEYKMLILNQEARKMFDYPVDDPNKFEEHIISTIIPDDLPNVRKAITTLFNPGDKAEYTFHSDTPNSGRKLFKCNTKVLSFEDGQKYVISSITDITEQELSEKHLDEERRQYRNALAYGSECLFTVDLMVGTVSEPVISTDGIDLTAAFGIDMPADYDDMAKIFFSMDRTYSDRNTVEKMQSKKSLIECYRNGTSLIDMEYQVPKKGKYYHVKVLLYEIEEHINATFVIYDITSDRREEKERMSVIDSLGQIYSAIFHYSLTDNKFTVYKASDDLAADLPDEISFSEFSKIYLEKYVLPEYHDHIAERLNPNNIRAILAKKDYVVAEYKRAGTGWCRANLVAAERDENGVVTAVVLAGHTIEKQKQAEFAQQEALKAAYEAANLASAAKTNFLAAMSHDIRTPMNAIIGMTAIAGTHIDDKERVMDCLSKINVSSKHLLGLINEVLDMSKIESGKMELQEEEFNLSELIENLLTMSKPEVAKKRHELSVSVRKIEHENVIGDSQRIQQVFMNLMSNAVKYTPEGGRIRLSISEKPTNKQNVGCYEFVFQDNGIGIAEDFIEHIFEPFSRSTNDTRVDKIQGTGLGMPITKNIVQMMNGDIKVESKINKGSKFTVTMFLKLRDKDEKLAYERFAELPVLVADDDADAGVFTCEMLSEIGMNGEWVPSGQKAVLRTVERHAEGKDFFAVILDWKMPGMDGLETAAEIRKKIGNEVPIIIISAYDWSDIEPKAKDAGINAFISKPLFKSRMVHLFNKLMDGENEPAEKAGYKQEDYADSNFKGKHILLVEDVEVNAEIAGEILRMMGFEVEFAENGKEALDIMTNIVDGYFDLILMDIQMPIMNGYEAAKAIRALPRDYTKKIPIIAMTANAFADDVASAKNAGMNEHVAKPIDINQLFKVLKKWLKG